MWPFYALGAVLLFIAFRKKTPAFILLFNGKVQYADPDSVEGGVIAKTLPLYHSAGGREVTLSNGHIMGEFDGSLNEHKENQLLQDVVYSGTTEDKFGVVALISDLAAIARGDAPLVLKIYTVDADDLALFAGPGSDYALFGAKGMDDYV